MEQPNYAGMTKQEQHAAVEAAESVEQLDAIWADLERVGYAREGMLHAAILGRKKALGAALDDEQEALIELMELRAAKGRALPAVEGKLGDK